MLPEALGAEEGVVEAVEDEEADAEQRVYGRAMDVRGESELVRP